MLLDSVLCMKNRNNVTNQQKLQIGEQVKRCRRQLGYLCLCDGSSSVSSDDSTTTNNDSSATRGSNTPASISVTGICDNERVSRLPRLSKIPSRNTVTLLCANDLKMSRRRCGETHSDFIADEGPKRPGGRSVSEGANDTRRLDM